MHVCKQAHTMLICKKVFLSVEFFFFWPGTIIQLQKLKTKLGYSSQLVSGWNGSCTTLTLIERSCWCVDLYIPVLCYTATSSWVSCGKNETKHSYMKWHRLDLFVFLFFLFSVVAVPSKPCLLWQVSWHFTCSESWLLFVSDRMG